MPKFEVELHTRPCRQVKVVDAFKKSNMQLSLCTNKVVVCRAGEPAPRNGYLVTLAGAPASAHGLRFFIMPPPPPSTLRNVGVPGWLIGTCADESEANVAITYTKVVVAAEAAQKGKKTTEMDKSFVVCLPIIQSIDDVERGGVLLMHKAAEEKVVVSKDCLNLSGQPAVKRQKQ